MIKRIFSGGLNKFKIQLELRSDFWKQDSSGLWKSVLEIIMAKVLGVNMKLISLNPFGMGICWLFSWFSSMAFFNWQFPKHKVSSISLLIQRVEAINSWLNLNLTKIAVLLKEWNNIKIINPDTMLSFKTITFENK